MKKIIIIMLVAMLTLTACNNDIYISKEEYQKEVDAITKDNNSETFEKYNKEQAYKAGENVLFVIQQYKKGASANECTTLLEYDIETFKEYEENEFLSDDDKLSIKAMELNTTELIKQINGGGGDVETYCEYIIKCLEKLK